MRSYKALHPAVRPAPRRAAPDPPPAAKPAEDDAAEDDASEDDASGGGAWRLISEGERRFREMQLKDAMQGTDIEALVEALSIAGKASVKQALIRAGQRRLQE